jgi:wyosine [tRNA(Phe)-imidazoG37] synthetase (radical SAM superfamily)
MGLLKLQGKLIYGPVMSRRLGSSLGINILPFDYKLCSFNCVYCQYGWTEEHTSDGRSHRDALPSAKDVADALREALAEFKRDGSLPGYLTFSGNGEPTLHPDFPEIVDVVLAVRDELAPNSLVAILSNSTTVGDEATRKVLQKLDLRIMKLDCADAETCASYNRPCNDFEWKSMLRGLRQLSSFTLQTLFTNLNSDDSAIAKWLELVKELGPEAVQVYTLDRAAPLLQLKPVSREKLSEIVKLVRSVAGAPAESY